MFLVISISLPLILTHGHKKGVDFQLKWASRVFLDGEEEIIKYLFLVSLVFPYGLPHKFVQEQGALVKFSQLPFLALRLD